jgi:hypothetical protein
VNVQLFSATARIGIEEAEATSTVAGRNGSAADGKLSGGRPGAKTLSEKLI